MNKTADISELKKTAVEFLQLVVAGRIDEAYRQYVDMSGKHHNAYFTAGFPALRRGMEENHLQFPDKHILPKHVLVDGDFVAVHSHVVLRAREKEIAVVHLFRFHNGKIVELWDCGQPIPVDCPNADGVF